MGLVFPDKQTKPPTKKRSKDTKQSGPTLVHLHEGKQEQSWWERLQLERTAAAVRSEVHEGNRNQYLNLDLRKSVAHGGKEIQPETLTALILDVHPSVPRFHFSISEGKVQKSKKKG